MVFEELSEMMQQMLDGKRVWYITYSVTNWSYMQQLLSEKTRCAVGKLRPSQILGVDA
jgi:hypothetical protein